MHIELPKPNIRSLKEFTMHDLMIVLSILTALGSWIRITACHLPCFRAGLLFASLEALPAYSSTDHSFTWRKTDCRWRIFASADHAPRVVRMPAATASSSGCYFASGLKAIVHPLTTWRPPWLFSP